jgi:hypothetical protein
MTREDLALYSASAAFHEDAIAIIGDVDEMTPDPFCSICGVLLDRDERGACRACSAICKDHRGELDRTIV